MVKTIFSISLMASHCRHSSVYEFVSGYISSAPSLSFVWKRGRETALLLFQLIDTLTSRTDGKHWIVFYIKMESTGQIIF